MSTRRKRTLAAALVLGPAAAFFAVGLSVSNASAATIQVNTTVMTIVNDSKCGLSEAVVAVNTKHAYNGCPAGTGNDTIQLQAANYVAVAALEITRGVTIKGVMGPPNLGPPTIIDGTHLGTANSALFYVHDDNGQMSVTFQNVRMEGSANQSTQVSGVWGDGFHGTNSTITASGVWIRNFTNSGIYADGFNLKVQNALIAQNNSTSSGGGIFFSDQSQNLTVSQSTFYTNGTDNAGGGIDYQGLGTSSVVNSTFNGNVAGFGGGLAIEGDAGTFTASFSTFTENRCYTDGTDCGGGVVSFIGDSLSTFSINASILTQNLNDSASSSDLAGDGVITVSNSMIYEGGNTAALFFNDGGGNTNGVDPQIDPDADNFGGAFDLPTCAPSANSPAVDYLASSSLTVDERNYPRGISRDGAPHAKLYDIGAVEFDPNTQAETLGLLSSSKTVSVVTGSGYSDGAGANLAATAVGDNAVYYIPVIGDENYDVKVRFATGSNEGIVQLEWSSDITFKTGVNKIGPAVDLYAKTAGFLSKDYNVSLLFDPDDNQYYRFIVTGKNSASSSFAVKLDYVNLVPR
jgi:hypothetical protein